jgi:class 3 adenylate cyclase
MTAPADGTAGAIVFIDIVGFTELTDQHGDDLALELVERQATVVRELLPAGARVVKELGDGLLVWFDDAAAAVATSVLLQERFRCEQVGDMPLWVRIGIHWGAPRRRGDDIIGRDVNLASRITALAGPGEVICTDAVVTEVSTHGTGAPADFASLGAVFVKGVADAVPVYSASCRHREEDVCASPG